MKIKESFRKYKFYWLAVSIVFIIVFAALFWSMHGRLTYSAEVNGAPIIMRDVDKNLQAVITFYTKTGVRNSPITAKDRKDLRRAMIEKLIENQLIETELTKHFSDYKTKVNEQIDKSLADSEQKQIEENASSLYNFSLQELRDRLLKPQAEKELLTDILSKSGVDFNEWLRKTKDDSVIHIFEPDFFWDETNLTVGIRQ